MIITEEYMKKRLNSTTINQEDSKELIERAIVAANLMIDGISDCYSEDQVACTDIQLLNLLKKHIMKYYV